MRLAVPTFFALTAEPFYVLVDTAIVGHLGRDQLAGVAIAGAYLAWAFGIFHFLAYNTTAAVARWIGATEPRRAVEQGLAGLWLALGLGTAITVVGLVLAPTVVDVMGASDAIRPYALTYIRISLIGAPMLMIMLAGVGYLRGTQDGRTPLVIAVIANVANLIIELVFVYGFDWGVAGSAWGTVIVQALSAVAFLVLIDRHRRRVQGRIRPDFAAVFRTARVGIHLMMRTAALIAAFTITTSLAARISDTAIAAHQIAFQIWLFLSFALDAVSIAGQSIVGKYLGAADPVGARQMTRRMLQFAVVTGILAAAIVVALREPLASIFTNDKQVQDALKSVLFIVALLQPIGAIAFVLDGILIGSGETRYLALAMLGATLAFLPCAIYVTVTEAGLNALWLALGVFLFARIIGLGARYRTDKWLITGACRT